MKKINLTVICVGDETYPGCVDLLEDCPSINVIARPSGLSEAGAWVALGRSDVLLFDEALLENEGHDAVRDIHASFPSIRSLMIIENESRQEMVSVLSLGVLGVITRASMTSMLCKAVSAIFTGEAWLSRGMVQPLRKRLGQEKGLADVSGELPDSPGMPRLH